jgi:ATP-dependent RNA helicase RhlE
MPSIISHLAKTILNSPVKVEITPAATTVEKIDQKIYLVERSNKTKLLKHVLEQDQAHSILVFLRTKSGADRLNDFLEKNGVKVETIHGDKSQSARELALVNFREGKARVLIATDIAARGIDIPGITHVINYDIPSDPESYVHRIGRTARAGKEGIAISFCDPTETLALKAIEKTINYQIPFDNTHPFYGVHGVSGVRKLSSAKKSENINSNETNKMTEPKKIQSGRKISSANVGEAKTVSSAQPRERSTESRERKPHPAQGVERKPRPAQGEHKKPHHHNKKKGLLSKLVDKVKAILGIKKEVKNSNYKGKNPRHNSRPRTSNNRAPSNRRNTSN